MLTKTKGSSLIKLAIIMIWSVFYTGKLDVVLTW